MSDKIFVLDTNVLIHNPKALFSFGNNTVVLSFTVIGELDKLKRGSAEKNRNARETSRFLDRLGTKGNLGKGVDLPNGGKLMIVVNHKKAILEKINELDLDPNENDDRIIATTAFLKSEHQNTEVILVTKDVVARIKSNALGITYQDFEEEGVKVIGKTEGIYSGQREFLSSKQDVDLVHQRKEVQIDSGNTPLYPNEFIRLVDETNPQHVVLAKHIGKNQIKQVLDYNASNGTFGLKSKNKEQNMAINLLQDKAVRIVTLSGVAGTGKTLLALAVGMHGIKKGYFNKIVVARPVIPLGKQDLGFLKGDLKQKLDPWVKAIYDNLGFLIRNNPENKINSTEDSKFFNTDTLKEEGLLEIESLAHIKGRTFFKSFFILDEAQDLTRREIKTVITRCGPGSKFVFTGDPDQIENPYIDSRNSGLNVLIETAKHLSYTGHILLTKSERSQVAEDFAKLL